MFRREFAFFLVLLALPVSGAEISSEQARLRATEYVKTPEAPIIYQQPIESFGTSFWVIELSSESPRFIAIEKTDATMTPLTEETVLTGIVETYMVAKFFSAEAEKSSFLFRAWKERIENTYINYYMQALSALEEDVDKVNDSSLSGPLTLFNTDLSAAVTKLGDVETSLTGVKTQIDSFVISPKYSQIILLKGEMQAAVQDVKDVIDELIDLKSDAENIRTLFIEDPDYEENYQVYSSVSQKLDFLAQTFSETLLNADKGTIEDTYVELETTMNTSRAVSLVRAQDSISRIQRVDIEKEMVELEPIITLMTTYSTFFQTSYSSTTTEVLAKWNEAGEDLSSGYFDNAETKLSDIKSSLATAFGSGTYNAVEIQNTLTQQINAWLATGQGPESPDYSGIINMLMIIVVVAVAGTALYTQRYKIKDMLSGGGDEEEPY